MNIPYDAGNRVPPVPPVPAWLSESPIPTPTPTNEEVTVCQPTVDPGAEEGHEKGNDQGHGDTASRPDWWALSPPGAAIFCKTPNCRIVELERGEDRPPDATAWTWDGADAWYDFDGRSLTSTRRPVPEYVDPPEPCETCGGLMFWWNVLGDPRCMRCCPPTTARRLLKLVKAMRGQEHVCGGSESVDVTTSNGKVRRDCKVCGRFIEWVKW